MLESIPHTTHPAYNLPEGALVPADWTVTPEDEYRLHTLAADEPLGDYFGSAAGRKLQRHMLAQERAWQRLGLDALRQEMALHSSILETLAAAERIKSVVRYTQLELLEGCSDTTDNQVHLKREDLQPIHAYKLRGAFNRIGKLSEEERSQGVVAASAGNAGLGVAYSAQIFGIPATIFMPEGTPTTKVKGVQAYGAEVVLAGRDYTEAAQYCQAWLQNNKGIMVPAFDHPDVIAGQGTIGKELLEQLPDAEYIFVQIGGGGLISGIAQYIKQLQPDIRIIGVEPEDNNAAQLSRQEDGIAYLPKPDLFAQSLAVKRISPLTHKIITANVDDLISTSNIQIRDAMRTIWEDQRVLVEPAGATGLAGAQKYLAEHDIHGAKVVTIASGANIDFDMIPALLA